MKNIKRILIDCSDTYICNLNTGIQRVVKNIVERSDLISSKLGVEVLPVVLDSCGYVELSCFLEKNQNITKKVSFKRDVKKFIADRIKNDKLYLYIKLLWHKLSKIYHYFKYLFCKLKKYQKCTINLEPGDVLLLIDAFWQPTYTQNKNFLKVLESIKKKDIILILLIYDIIALTNPEFFDKVFVEKFQRSLNLLLKYSSAILTISESEKNIIEKYLNENLGIDKPIDYFYLGSDFCKKNDGFIRESLKAFEQMKYFLVVGTVEPRKGHEVILDAFESMWEDGFEDSLVIVGRIGWKVENIVKRIYNSKYKDKKLFFFNEINDAELEFLYKNAKALIFASKREGFGLPLVEAISKNLAVIASDIDVFREIGKDYPIYFNPSDKNSLISAIKSVDLKKFDSSYFKVYTWDDSVKELSSKLYNIIKQI